MPQAGEREQILGALRGLATGDAVGKQTEGLDRDRVRRWYPLGIRGFEGRPGEAIPRYRGNPRREWRIAETTDDTECTIAVAKALLRDPEVSHTTVGEELLRCRKSVHPGVKSYWEFHQAGDPGRIAKGHDGCGAAIRVSPIGIVCRPGNLDAIVARARQASIPTHAGPLAIAAAAATAASVSAAIEGWAARDVALFAAEAARRAERVDPPAAGHAISDAIVRVHESLTGMPALQAPELAAAHFPDHPLRIVPLAIALATATASAPESALLAANVGGDADSVASIAGAIAGALRPETVNEAWWAAVREVNPREADELLSLAERLLQRRG